MKNNKRRDLTYFSFIYICIIEKDDKKDNKKQGKQPEQPPPEEVKKEEPLVPEKEYKKAND